MNQPGETAGGLIKKSLEAIGTKENREKIRNLVSLADCMSPGGKYTTEIHTASGGYTYFKQVYSYKPKPFEAVIVNRDSGFITGDPSTVLSKELISMIRGHAFHNIILEVDRRFHDLEKPRRVYTGGKNAYRVTAKDELNNPCLLFFDPETGLLSAIHTRNPGDTNEVIQINFSCWRKLQGLLLPVHAGIIQEEKRYDFDFTKVLFNSPDFKMFPAGG